MSNVLSEEKRQQVLALGRLGWPLRRIEEETGVRRETASGYLKVAGIGVRPSGAWGWRPPKPAKGVTTGSDEPISSTVTPHPNHPKPENLPAKGKSKTTIARPAKGVITGFGVELSDVRRAPTSSLSTCEPFREAIELGLSQGCNAAAIWHDLVTENGFCSGYQTVKHFARKLRGTQPQRPVVRLVLEAMFSSLRQ